MLNDLLAESDTYLVTGYTDLRRGIDGLAGIIQCKLNLDPYSRAVFLFCGRRCDRIKGLVWEGDGFLLLYKRLDNGAFRWPRNETEALMLTEQQIRWLTEGLEIEHRMFGSAEIHELGFADLGPKAIKSGKPGLFY